MASKRKTPKPDRATKRPRMTDLRALLADIVQSSDEAIFSRALDGTITSWNAAAERIFGYRAEEIIGQSSAVLLPSDRVEEMKRLMESIRRGERVDHFETIRLRKDGKPLALWVCVSPIRDARGRVVGASTIARDMTAERDLETRLLEAGEHERQRVGRDLHDGLGQQLSGLELLCRTLTRALEKRGLPEAKTAHLMVSQIQEAIVQTRALARGLTPVMDRPNGLMLALEELARTTRTLFGVRCAFHCEEPVLLAEHTSALHLYRIAQESVTNAVRHGQARRVDVSLARTARNLVLEIRDNGTGLPARPRNSDGMGFSIMKYRTSMLDGTLRVQNTPPRGAAVICMVPLTHLEIAPYDS